jgi:hypothetical protein
MIQGVVIENPTGRSSDLIVKTVTGEPIVCLSPVEIELGLGSTGTYAVLRVPVIGIDWQDPRNKADAESAAYRSDT